MKLMTFESFAPKYLNTQNPSTGKNWTESDAAVASQLPLPLVHEWFQICKDANLAAIEDHMSPATVDEIIAAFRKIHPGQEPVSIPFPPGYIYKASSSGTDRPLTEMTESDLTTLLTNIISTFFGK